MLNPSTNGLSFQQENLASKRLLAAAYEIQLDSESEHSELKATLAKFAGHNKNQINIGLTGTIQGTRLSGTTKSWASQNAIHDDDNLNMINNGGRINCIRASEANLDGIWIKSTASPPYKYNHQAPLSFANL